MNLSDSLDDSLQNLKKRSEALDQEFESNRKGSSGDVDESLLFKNSSHKRFLTQQFNFTEEEQHEINSEENDSTPQSVVRCDGEVKAINYPLQSSQMSSQFVTRAPGSRAEPSSNSMYLGICNQRLHIPNQISSMSSPQQDNFMWSLSSNKLTYSTDKKSPDVPNRYITFGQVSSANLNLNHNPLQRTPTQAISVDSKLLSAEQLIQQEQFGQALKVLQSTEKEVSNEQLLYNRIFLNYLYAIAFYAIERWEEFYYSANEVVQMVFSQHNSQNRQVQLEKEIDMLLHCLQMLVTSDLKHSNFRSALKHQAMLVELANGRGESNVEQLIILGEIHKKLQRNNEAFLVFLKAQSLQQEPSQRKLTLSNLFFLSQELGRDQECIKFGQELLPIAESDLGIIICQTIAKQYHSLQNYSQTLIWLQELLTRQIAESGYNHMSTCTSLMNIGKLMQLENNFKDSFEMFKKASASLGTLIGHQNVQYAFCQMSLGLTCFYLGRYEESYDHYSQASHLYDHLFGAQHENSIRIKFNLMQIVVKLKQSEKIQSHYSDYLNLLKQLTPKQLSVQFGNELGNIMLSNNLLTVALDAYFFTMETLSQLDETETLQLQKCLLLQNIGSTYLQLDDIQQSLNSFRNAQRIAVQLKDIKMVADIENKIGNCFHQAGRVKEAQVHRKHSKKILQDPSIILKC